MSERSDRRLFCDSAGSFSVSLFFNTTDRFSKLCAEICRDWCHHFGMCRFRNPAANISTLVLWLFSLLLSCVTYIWDLIPSHLQVKKLNRSLSNKSLLTDSTYSDINECLSLTSDCENFLTPRPVNSEQKIDSKSYTGKKHSSTIELGAVLQRDKKTYRLKRSYKYKERVTWTKADSKNETTPLLDTNIMPKLPKVKAKDGKPTKKHNKVMDSSSQVERSDANCWDNAGDKKRVCFSPRSEAFYYEADKRMPTVQPVQRSSFMACHVPNFNTDGIEGGYVNMGNGQRENFPLDGNGMCNTGPPGINSTAMPNVQGRLPDQIPVDCAAMPNVQGRIPGQIPVDRSMVDELRGRYDNDGATQYFSSPRYMHGTNYNSAPSSFDKAPTPYYHDTGSYIVQHCQYNGGARAFDQRNQYAQFDGPNNMGPRTCFYEDPRYGYPNYSCSYNDPRSHLQSYRCEYVPIFPHEQNSHYYRNDTAEDVRNSIPSNHITPYDASGNFCPSSRRNEPNFTNFCSPRSQILLAPATYLNPPSYASRYTGVEENYKAKNPNMPEAQTTNSQRLNVNTIRHNTRHVPDDTAIEPQVTCSGRGSVQSVDESSSHSRSSASSINPVWPTSWRREQRVMIAQHPRLYNDTSTKKRSRKLESIRKRSLRTVKLTYGDHTTETEQQNHDDPPPVQVNQAAQIKRNPRPLAELQSWYANNGSSSDELQKCASNLEKEDRNNGRSLLRWPSDNIGTDASDLEPRHGNYDDVVTDPRWTFNRIRPGSRPRYAESFELLCRNDYVKTTKEPRGRVRKETSRVGYTNSYEMLTESKKRSSQIMVAKDSKLKKSEVNRASNNGNKPRRDSSIRKQRHDKNVNENKIESSRNSASVLRNEKQESSKNQTQRRVLPIQRMVPSTNNLFRESGENRIRKQRRIARWTHLSRSTDALDSSPERPINMNKEEEKTLFECGKSEASPTSPRHTSSSSLDHLAKDASQHLNRHKYSPAFKSLAIDTFASESKIKDKKQKPVKARCLNYATGSAGTGKLSRDENASRNESKKGKILSSKEEHHEFERGADSETLALEEQSDLTSSCTSGDTDKDGVNQAGSTIQHSCAVKLATEEPTKVRVSVALKPKEKNLKKKLTTRRSSRCKDDGFQDDHNEETSSESDKLRRTFKKIPSRRTKCGIADFSTDSVHVMPVFVQVIPVACSSEEKQIAGQFSKETLRTGSPRSLCEDSGRANEIRQCDEMGNLGVMKDEHQTLKIPLQSLNDGDTLKDLSTKMRALKLADKDGSRAIKSNKSKTNPKLKVQKTCQAFLKTPQIEQEELNRMMNQQSVSSGYKSVDYLTESREDIPNTSIHNSTQNIDRLGLEENTHMDRHGTDSTERPYYYRNTAAHKFCQTDSAGSTLKNKPNENLTFVVDGVRSVTRQKLKAVRRSKENVKLMPLSQIKDSVMMSYSLAEIEEINKEYNSCPRTVTSVGENGNRWKGSSQFDEVLTESEGESPISPACVSSSSRMMRRSKGLVEQGQAMHLKSEECKDSVIKNVPDVTLTERNDITKKYKSKSHKIIIKAGNAGEHNFLRNITSIPLESNDECFEMVSVESDDLHSTPQLPMNMCLNSLYSAPNVPLPIVNEESESSFTSQNTCEVFNVATNTDQNGYYQTLEFSAGRTLTAQVNNRLQSDENPFNQIYYSRSLANWQQQKIDEIMRKNTDVGDQLCVLDHNPNHHTYTKQGKVKVKQPAVSGFSDGPPSYPEAIAITDTGSNRPKENAQNQSQGAIPRRFPNQRSNFEDHNHNNIHMFMNNANLPMEHDLNRNRRALHSQQRRVLFSREATGAYDEKTQSVPYEKENDLRNSTVTNDSLRLPADERNGVSETDEILFDVESGHEDQSQGQSLDGGLHEVNGKGKWYQKVWKRVKKLGPKVPKKNAN